VNVERTPPADDRHSDLTFAINDAFKHARRQLQDQVRRAQGQVKHVIGVHGRPLVAFSYERREEAGPSPAISTMHWMYPRSICIWHLCY
jgi:hypothetical protein